jgi:pimeloyl-ACP methyl ester carboxylesterase
MDLRSSMLVVLLVAGCGRGPRHPTGALGLKPCQLAPASRAECGRLHVPAIRGAKEGATLELQVTVLPATGPSPAGDALVVLSRDAGRSATSEYVRLAPVLARQQRDRELLLVDPRGTGASDRPASPAGLGTAVTAEDLEDARAALGYDGLTLLGEDYGTRVALVYARQHPGRVRAMVLVGVEPLEIAQGSDRDYNQQAALRALLGRCEHDPACAARFPRLRAEVERMPEVLVERPVRKPAPRGEASVGPGALALDEVRRALAWALEDAERSARLPAILHAAASGDEGPLALLVKASREPDPAVTLVTREAIRCKEDLPFFAARPDETRFFGGSLRAELESSCPGSPTASIDWKLDDPVAAPQPVLLVSTAGDPISPGRYTDVALNYLRRAVQVVLRGNGRPDLSRGCLPELVASFVSTGGNGSLDTSCARAIDPVPFALELPRSP